MVEGYEVGGDLGVIEGKEVDKKKKRRVKGRLD